MQAVSESRAASEAALALPTERHFRWLIENALDVVTLVDRDGAILYESPSLERVLGYKPEEMVGRSAFELVHPEDVRRVLEVFREGVQLAGACRAGEFRFRHRDGSWRVLDCLGENFLDDPHLAAVMISSRDVTDRKRVEQSLRESDAHKRAILESALDCIITFDQDGAITEFNPAAERTFGYRRAEAVGRELADLVFPNEARAAHRGRVSKYLDVGEGSQIGKQLEIVALRADGSEFPAEMALTATQADGQPVFTVILRDVTKRKQAEQALRQSEERFSLFMRHIPGVAFMKDRRGRYVYVNEPFERTFHTRLCDLRDKTDPEIWPPQTAAQFMENDRLVFESGMAMQTMETVPHDDGEHSWLVGKFPIPDEEGTPFLLGGIAIDVSDRKAAEQAVRDSEAKFRRLLESAPDATVIIDQRGRITLVNAQAESLFGYSREELLGQPVEALVPAEFPKAALQRRAAPFSSPPDRPAGMGLQLVGRRKDGTEFPVAVSLSPLETKDGSFVMSAMRDITELREAQERALRAEHLAAIGQMATGLAHESRNALQRSQACLEMLALELVNQPKALELVDRIQSAQDRLHRLYEEVRAYAAPSVLRREPCHLGAVFEQAWDHLAGLRAGREVELQEHAADLDLRCEADSHSIEQVFLNILENALAACSDPVRIDARWSAAEIDGQPALRVAVCDNGPGFTGEQRERLFEPFYTTKSQGTGLGMAIAKRIVETHGGRIAAGEDRRCGAEIVVVLPRRRP